MYFARKIAKSKWEFADSSLQDKEFFEQVASDLNAADGELSFWSCGDASAQELEDVVLALATARDRLDKVDLCWIAEEQIASCGIERKFRDGRTPVTAVRALHVTLKGLDQQNLLLLARELKTAVDAGRLRRYIKSEVRLIVVDAMESGRFDLSDVHKRLAAELTSPGS